MLEGYTAASIATHIRELSQRVTDETKGEIELISLISTKLTNRAVVVTIVGESKEVAERVITTAYTAIQEKL